jgi:hypothetical protein
MQPPIASRNRAGNIARARELLAVPKPRNDAASADASEPLTHEHPCPCCGGRMIIIETFERGSTPRTHMTLTHSLFISTGFGT